MSDSKRHTVNTDERMTCESFELAVEDYHRKSLSKQEIEHCDAHMESCARCRSTLDLWRSFSDSVNGYLPPPLPPLVERRMIVDAMNAAASLPARSSRRWAMAAAISGIGVAAAATVLFVFLNGSTPDEVEAPIQDQIAQAPSPSLPVRTETIEGGRTLMRIDPVTELWVDGESSVDLTTNTAKEARVKLTRGRIIADIGPHASGYRFIVSTPQGEVEAKGTVFSVEVADGVETARVIEGAVEVRRGRDDKCEGAFMVLANQEGEIGDAAARWSKNDTIQRDICLMHGCRNDTSATVVAAEGLHEIKERHERKYARAAPPEETKSKRAKAGSDAKPRSAPRAEKKTPRTEPATPATAVSTSSMEAATEGSSEAVELMRAALRQRRAGQFQAAASTYNELIQSYPGTQESLNALVSLGQLELTSLSTPQKALAHFDEYLRRSSSGVLAQEARLGKVRASWRAGRYAQAEAASTDYLKIHPGGYAGSEVMKIRGDARRKLGDCVGAVKDYTQIRFWWPTSTEAAAVESGIAACSGQ